MSLRMQAFCAALASIIGLGVAAVIAYACWGTFAMSLRFGTVSIQPSATPIWMPQIVMPVAMGWLCLLYADAFFRSVKNMLESGR